MRSGTLLKKEKSRGRHKDSKSKFSIVIGGDWLWKTKNIKCKNNSDAVYIGSSLTVRNPLFVIE